MSEQGAAAYDDNAELYASLFLGELDGDEQHAEQEEQRGPLAAADGDVSLGV
mgnify:CR=1 FL=1